MNNDQIGTTYGTPATDPATVQPTADPLGLGLLDAFSDEDEKIKAGVVDEATAVVLETNASFVSGTRSTLRPEDITTPRLMLSTVVLDTSGSMITARLVAAQLLAHDHYIESLRPASTKNVTILVTCVGLNGGVIYPFTPIHDVPLFGNEPQPWDTEKPQSNGRIYGQATLDFTRQRMFGGTPLFDRMVSTVVAAREEAAYWRKNSGRIPEIVTVFLTDGQDEHSREFDRTTTARFFDELSEDGRVTVLFMDMAAGLEEGTAEYENWRARFVSICTEQGVNLPDNVRSMTNAELLKWYFKGITVPHAADGDPRKIRRIMGLFSQVAETKSQLATEDSDEDR